MYCVVSVTLNKPFVFLTNLAEPVPSATISNTISNDEVVLLINAVAIEAVVRVCVESVILIDKLVFYCKVGIEPIPFSIIFITISNPFPIFVISDNSEFIDDVV